jgi:hypothetical protein
MLIGRHNIVVLANLGSLRLNEETVVPSLMHFLELFELTWLDINKNSDAMNIFTMLQEGHQAVVFNVGPISLEEQIKALTLIENMQAVPTLIHDMGITDLGFQRGCLEVAVNLSEKFGTEIQYLVSDQPVRFNIGRSLTKEFLAGMYKGNNLYISDCPFCGSSDAYEIPFTNGERRGTCICCKRSSLHNANPEDKTKIGFEYKRAEEFSEEEIQIGLERLERLRPWFEIPKLDRPLSGEWRYSNGYVCCGSMRIFRLDIDTNPSEEYIKTLMAWVIQTLNKG